ncbi:MAG: DUF3301 domain-containing protein [Marinobacter sp.]|uniref:DUF3301 domain-containing protein n=1 Tax=Marinobacter sp. TaxID=50741 RepID=UPI001B7BAEF2|nr:DUF3301 domain-containing protein [Marinobacter sp.]MBQ0748427.1 DUF3301 domain-containing protein [Marinobacter sp.]MBQ0812880.1 DUF3301 domain-containing protein [Marinobacter sp.]|tara:strand:- start:14359 stop:14673 length:315 start_codon:yes stop_codon:yes gene_type:complete
MTLGTLFWLFVAAFFIWYWWRAKAIKDSVLQATHRYCKTMDVMLLDDAIYLRGIWFRRDDQGKIRVWRRFMFDFTSTGEERYSGRVIMLGSRILHMELDPHRIP